MFSCIVILPLLVLFTVYFIKHTKLNSMTSEVKIDSTKDKSRCKYYKGENSIETQVFLGRKNKHHNDKSIYKRQSKFVIPDLELVTVFEQDGDLMSSAQEISYKTDMIVSLPSNNLSPISATYNQRHEKLRLL